MTKMNTALSEVNEILKYLPKEDYDKIPKDIINVIEENMDKTYNWKLDFSKDLMNQNISREAVAVLSYINMEYLLSKEQKDVMEKIHKFNEYKAEEMKKEKYDSIDIFKNNLDNKKDIEEEVNSNATLPIEYKRQNFIDKILSKIKSFFKFNK